MRTTNPLLGMLSKGITYADSEAGDSIIRVPPLVMPVSSIPYPVKRVFSAPTAGIFTDSLHLADAQGMSSATNVTLITLGEGIWDIWWQHYLDQTGGINDGSSQGDISLNWATIFGGSVTLSRIRNTLIQQRNEGQFTVSIEKGKELSFIRQTTAGLGTGTGNSLFTLHAQKLL